LFDSANATAATFFANAIDTQSKGIDVVISQSYRRKWVKKLIYLELSQIQKSRLSTSAEANNGVNKYYSETSRIYLEAVPRVKAKPTLFL
jgi:iron complex outermembrane receptor protein